MTEMARAGSQRWLQVAVNNRPELINRHLHDVVGGTREIEWLSPRRDDGYREYWDGAALRLLGVDRLDRRPLLDYWPGRGPVWDALGRTTDGEFLLVEAKAHIPELASGATKADGASLERIQATLGEVRRALAPRSNADWTQTFYQYTNRLAFLYLLRTLNGLPAHLVHIFFLNAEDVGGPSTPDAWKGALEVLHTLLGLGDHPLSQYVHELYVDVHDLKPVPAG